MTTGNIADLARSVRASSFWTYATWEVSMRNTTTRRELLLVASLGGVAATAGMVEATAQESASIGLGAKRDFHTDWLVASANAHDGAPVLSRDGMNKSLALLENKYRIVSEAEARTLGDLISLLFEDDNLDQLVGDVHGIIEEGASILGETAESIAAVIQSSVEYAGQRLTSVDYSIAQNAIAHDVQGALQGAAAGAVLGSMVPALGLSTGAGAAIGALIGGAASSVIGYSE